MFIRLNILLASSYEKKKVRAISHVDLYFSKLAIKRYLWTVFVSGFINEIHDTRRDWIVQDEFTEADLMDSMVRSDTRWHEERRFYTEKVKGFPDI